MACYTYRCRECGQDAEIYQSIKAYCEKPMVPVCVDHGPMERYLTKPMVTFDTAPWASYQSPIDGSVITSRAERNEHMARHGVVMYDDIAPDIKRNAERRKKDAVADVKEDLIAASFMVEAGHKPQMVDTIVPEEVSG